MGPYAGGVFGGESGEEGTEKKSGEEGREGRVWEAAPAAVACVSSDGAGERFANGSSSSKSGGGELRGAPVLDVRPEVGGMWRGGR